MAALVPHSPPPRRSSSFASSLSSSSRGGGGTSSSALSRQGARLGIITAYKDLNLHSAAAKGNIGPSTPPAQWGRGPRLGPFVSGCTCHRIASHRLTPHPLLAGLVQYALANGQPVNSVLDGVLPIHAAASSGSETVVRMLIEAGADVNSPRVSRRYTREGTKSSGQSVGTRGELQGTGRDSGARRGADPIGCPQARPRFTLPPRTATRSSSPYSCRTAPTRVSPRSTARRPSRLRPRTASSTPPTCSTRMRFSSTRRRRFSSKRKGTMTSEAFRAAVAGAAARNVTADERASGP